MTRPSSFHSSTNRVYWSAYLLLGAADCLRCLKLKRSGSVPSERPPIIMPKGFDETLRWAEKGAKGDRMGHGYDPSQLIEIGANLSHLLSYLRLHDRHSHKFRSFERGPVRRNDRLHASRHRRMFNEAAWPVATFPNNLCTAPNGQFIGVPPHRIDPRARARYDTTVFLTVPPKPRIVILDWLDATPHKMYRANSIPLTDDLPVFGEGHYKRDFPNVAMFGSVQTRHIEQGLARLAVQFRLQPYFETLR